MKTFRLALLVTLWHITQTVFSQSATSINNGPWLSPFTWSCTCVPTPGYTVTINHQVTLNTSFQLPSGGITVNANGALLQDSARDMMINGGYIVNHGKIDFRYLLLQSGYVTNTDTLRLKSFANYANINNSGVFYQLDSFQNLGYLHNTGKVLTHKFQNIDSIINDGLFIAQDSFFNMGLLSNSDSILSPSFLNTGTFANNGWVIEVDSFTNAGTINNNATGTIRADSMLNSGAIVNNGLIQTTAFANFGTILNNNTLTFYDAFNLSLVVNNDSISGTRHFYNAGRLNNAIAANIYLGGSFVNADSLAHDALLFNDGIMVVDSNWFNADSIDGNFGSITVAQQSNNAGKMAGSFDFCDLTPPPTAPFIDNNSGTISPQITWCSPAAPHAFFSAGNACLGNAVAFINGSSGNISNFVWYFGDGNTSSQNNPTHWYSTAGTYVAMLVAMGANSNDTSYATVHVFDKPATPQVSENNGMVMCSATAVNYHWYKDNVFQNLITTQNFVATQSGYYSVQIVDSNGCISNKSDSVLVDLLIGVPDMFSAKAVIVFPQPFTANVIIEINDDSRNNPTLEVYNIMGSKIWSDVTPAQNGNKTRFKIDLQNYPSGVYVYLIRLGTKISSGRMIKQ